MKVVPINWCQCKSVALPYLVTYQGREFEVQHPPHEMNLKVENCKDNQEDNEE